LASVTRWAALAHALWAVFLVMALIFGVVAWLYVLAQESRRVALSGVRSSWLMPTT
jgi:hypothetical protein